MPFLGEKLRHKRMAMGFSLKEAAKKSGLKRKQAEALEREDVLSFRDKNAVIESLTRYASTLDLGRGEIIDEFEYLWSDSSTAKAYLQRSYGKSGRGIFGTDRKLVDYGVAAVLAALFLSAGGYMIWGSFGEHDVPDGLIASPVEESEKQDAVKKEMEGPFIDRENNEVEQVAGEQDKTDPEDITRETDPVLVSQNNSEKKSEQDKEPEVEPEPDKEQVIADLEEEGESVPRTGGNINLLLTGFSFIVSGLMLLFSKSQIGRCGLSRIAGRCF